MSKKIKINFKNFWSGFNLNNNLIYSCIRYFFPGISVEINSKNPDIIFYSVHSHKNSYFYFPEKDIANFKKTKVLFR